MPIKVVYNNFGLSESDMEIIENYLFEHHEYPYDINDKDSITSFVRSNKLQLLECKTDDETGLIELSGKCITSHDEMYQFKRRYNYDRQKLFIMIVDSLIDGRFWCVRLGDGLDHIDLSDNRNVEIIMTLILRTCF